MQAFDFFLGMVEKDSYCDPVALSFQAVSQNSWLLEGPGHSVLGREEYGTLSSFQPVSRGGCESIQFF